MNIDNEIAQYYSEEKYSKKNLINVILGSMNAQNNKDVMFKLVSAINKYFSTCYWETKNDYITTVLMSDTNARLIAEHIIISSLKHPNTVINNIANEIGTMFISSINNVFTRVQLSTDLLLACEDIIYDLVVTSNDGIMFNSWITLNSDDMLTVSKFLYQPPMKCKPLNISNNNMSGYLTYNESILLGNAACKHNKKLSLDVINIQNGIQFTLDKFVLMKEEKPKNKLTGDNLKNWEQFTKECDSLYTEYKDKEFYLTHKFDSRGRLYSQGYHINYQSTEYRKALFNLAKKEICDG